MKVGIVGLGYWGKKIFKEYLNLVSEGMIDDLHLYDINSNILTDEIFHGLNVVIHDSYQSLIDAVDAIQCNIFRTVKGECSSSS